MAHLREVARAEGVVQVHVPFSLADLSQVEQRLGSFFSNPIMFAKQFKYLTQAYKLTWHDVLVVLQFTLTPEEYDHVKVAAQHCANEAHTTDKWEPMGREAVPLQEPLWDYNYPKGEVCRDCMVRYLLAGMNLTTQKAINYDKVGDLGLEVSSMTMEKNRETLVQKLLSHKWKQAEMTAPLALVFT
ncbi:Rho Guanine Nucleotide Exchange Factor 12 [Manis pentadactyla]|nr:Rho Guanine Nucleotide Exchange Factor 12 [Manis pentadactyla]